MIAHGGQHPRADLAAVIDWFRVVAPPEWAIVAERDRVIVAPFADVDGIDWARTVDGSLFGPAGELRWRNDADRTFVVAITAPDVTPPFEDLAPVELTGGTPVRFFLLGRFSAGRWREGRLPRPLDYRIAATDGDRLVVTAERWQPADGAGDLHRFVQIEAQR